MSEKTNAQILADLPCGRIANEDINFYHNSPCVSVSKMKTFRHSPALYYGRYVTGRIPKPEPTPALLFGSAIGTLVLEGRAKFDAEYYVVPKGVGKKKVADVALRAELEAANEGKKEVSFDDMARMETMLKKVTEHRFAGQLIGACKPEITWRMKGELFYLQVRTDGWSDEGCELTQGEPFILDLKSIQEIPDDEPDTLPAQISNYFYHGQCWTYRELVATISKFPAGFRPRFFFVFVEKIEPFGVQVVELDELALECAEKQVRETLERMRWCHMKNRWPDTWAETWREKIPTIALPNYYVKREFGEERRSIW